MTIRNAQAAVGDFMRAGGQSVAEAPRGLNYGGMCLRYYLGQEELNEYRDAAEKGEIVGIADALADQLYILLGTACAHGIDLQPVFEEVHRSNMTKVVDGKLVLRDDGKVLKPEGYEPPNIAAVLERQGK